MDRKRSYVTFTDGTEADILWFEQSENNHVLFVTKDGVYTYIPSIQIPSVTGLEPHEFYRVYLSNTGVMSMTSTSSIKSICIDTRVEYNVYIPVLGSSTILAAPDASDKDIALAIVTELNAEWERV